MSTPRPVLPFPAPQHHPEPKPSVDSQSFEMVGESEAMQRLRIQVRRIGPHFRTVLLRGEIGTGKELAARALHNASLAAGGPFVVCHAASLEDAAADGTAEDWLRNLTTTALSGTLYIDAIEEMPRAAQSRLLAILKKKMPQRIIASTCEDLRELVVSGRFRQDLYHRIAMLEITLPPLRERVDDIERLAMHYLRRFSALYGRSIHTISEDALQRMQTHSWPGNVRELENMIRNGVLQCERAVLWATDLTTPSELMSHTPSSIASMSLQNVIDTHVRCVLRTCGGNKVKAAEMLGISRSTLYRMLEFSSHQSIEDSRRAR